MSSHIYIICVHTRIPMVLRIREHALSLRAARSSPPFIVAHILVAIIFNGQPRCVAINVVCSCVFPPASSFFLSVVWVWGPRKCLQTDGVVWAGQRRITQTHSRSNKRMYIWVCVCVCAFVCGAATDLPNICSCLLVAMRDVCVCVCVCGVSDY